MRHATMGKLLFGPVFVLLVLCQAHRAEACSCAAFPDDLEAAVAMAYAQADVVFLGDVRSVRNVVFSTPPRREAEFLVHKRWKGSIPDTTLVQTTIGEAACGYDFEMRENYLVFAYWDRKREHLTTSFCDLTRTEAEGKDAIVILDRLAKRGNSAAWHEFGESTLAGREFALFHDMWAIHIPGGKPLQFREDGTVDCPDNLQYHGANWSVQEEVLRIAGFPFVYNSTRDCWFSPVNEEYPDMGACIVPKGSTPKDRFSEQLNAN